MNKTRLSAAALMTTVTVAVGATAPVAASAATAQVPSAQDVQYLKTSAAMDLEEIAAGAVAYHKATYPQTKAYGKRLVLDHTKHYAELTVLARSYGLSLPTTLPASVVAMIKDMGTKPGAAFDVAYLKAEVSGHFAALALGTMEIERGSNVRVVKNAEQTSPIIRYHLWRGGLDLHYELWSQSR